MSLRPPWTMKAPTSWTAPARGALSLKTTGRAFPGAAAAGAGAAAGAAPDARPGVVRGLGGSLIREGFGGRGPLGARAIFGSGLGGSGAGAGGGGTGFGAAACSAGLGGSGGLAAGWRRTAGATAAPGAFQY